MRALMLYIWAAPFSARAYADNPDDEGLKRSVEYCHFYGRKLYLAVNTLLKQDEIDNALYNYMAAACEAGIDGTIVQDFGVMKFINDRIPGLPIHISTQVSIMTAGGAEYLRSKYPSVTRVVPARELSIDELRRLRSETDLEIEVFVHGALCFCYSGMCLMSSYIGDRSGNRGRCAQPCRKMYDPGSYLLSPKDQCLLEDLPELIETGIDSFKIEGRMKSPEYTAGTVAVYRHRIDEICGQGRETYSLFNKKTDKKNTTDLDKYDNRKLNDKVDHIDKSILSLNLNNACEEGSGKKVLAELYNRGGFNRGYLHERNGRDMMSMLRPNHSGVEVGAVEKVSGREASIRLTERLYEHDVLEIRRGENSIFEFTTAQENDPKDLIKVLTMKDKRAAVGDRVFRTRCNKLLELIRNDYVENDLKLPVNISFKAKEGSNAVLEICCAAHKKDPSKIIISDTTDICITIEGVPAVKAQKSPITAESIRKQLNKLGDTRFETENINIDIDENLFIPVSQLNDMRREGCVRLERAIIEAAGPKWKIIDNENGNDIENDNNINNDNDNDKKNDNDAENDDHNVDSTGSNKKSALKLSGANAVIEEEKDDLPAYRVMVTCSTIEQIIASAAAGIQDICFNIYNFDPESVDNAINAAGGSGKMIIGLPYAGRYDVIDRSVEFIKKINRKYPNIRFMVRNFDELAMIKKYFLDIISEKRVETDYMPYTLNSFAFNSDAYRITLSTEADINELKQITGSINKKMFQTDKREFPETSLIVYGYQPSMISAQCVFKNISGKCGKGTISDPTMSSSQELAASGQNNILTSHDRTFRTRQQCGFCTNIIYNSVCLNNLDMAHELLGIGIDCFRIDLTFETAKETEQILKPIFNDEYFRTMSMENGSFTRGHLHRRVM